MMIFLADGEDVFRIFMVIVFMFVSFMGWVGQFMKNRQQGAQRNRPRPRQDADVKNEIERFLEEVTGQQKRTPPERPKPARRVEAERRQPDTRPAEPNRQKPPVRRKPKRRVERDTSKPTAKVDSKVTSPVVTQPTPSSSAPTNVNIPVPPRRTAAASQNRDLVTTLGSSLAEQLRSPEKVRQAIMLNMILGPPRSKDPNFTRRPGGSDLT